MQKSNIHANALEKLSAGVHSCASVVMGTMGPKGKNVLIQSKLEPGHRLTNDGATIIQSMQMEDQIENMGLNFLKEAVSRSNNNSGDGSSTTVCLLSSILSEGMKTGNSTLEIKESLDECLPLIEQSIKKQTKEITVDDIPAVARIAGEDEELAQMLGEVYKTIGKDGIIHLEGSGSYETSFKLTEGVRFKDTGYLSPYMAYNEDASDKAQETGRSVWELTSKAEYKNPTILVTKNKIEHTKDIDPILQALIARGDKTLVIYTMDMGSDVARLLIELQKEPKRSINILIIKAATLWAPYVFEEFANVTGATIIEDAAGTSLGNKFRLDWLGTCDTLISEKNETILIGTKDISDHIRELEEEGSNDSKQRLAWLNTKTAVLKLGAKSETELSYRLLKAEDSIYSSKLSLQYGIVPGGGVALRNAIEDMPETIGGNIMRNALIAPITQIMLNAGYELESNRIRSISPESKNMGYDAKTDEIVDMVEAGIIDSSSVVLNAVRNSLGIASTLLTTSSVITLPPERVAPQASPFPFN